jgi:hypothetical protein
MKPMKKHVLQLLLGLIISAIFGAHEALASTTSMPSLQQNELAIRLGALFPNSGDARSFGGQTQLALGLDYTLAATRGSSPSATNAFFDYFSGSKNNGYVHSGGLGLAVRTLGPGYFGAGLGLYNTAVRTPNGERSGNSTGAGGKVFAGYELGNRASLQLDYHIAPSALGVNPSGLGVEIGFRL